MSAAGTSYRCVCPECGAESEARAAAPPCAECGEPVDIRYGAGTPARALPLRRPGEALRLGEGDTPCVRLERIGAVLGVELHAKLEHLAPTGSFKDRGSAVMLSAAREDGVEAFVEDSSGNAGASMAAYAAAAGLRMELFLPAGVSAAKAGQARLHGVRTHLVPGLRQAAAEAARGYALEVGLPYLSHNLSPHFIHGMRGFGYEAMDHFGDALDHIVFPVGNGSLLLGAWLAYGGGEGRGAPRLHCAQAAAVAPIHAALSGAEAGDAQGTIATGIAVSRPPRGRQVAAAVRGSGGSSAAVGEGEIAEWQRRLAREEGLFCEPSSAAGLAGLAALVAAGAVGAGSRVLVPITGSGLKEPIPDEV